MDHYRPAYAFFENVRDVQRFSLPQDADPKGVLPLLIDGLIRLG